MHIDIQLTQTPIADAFSAPAELAGIAGAWVEFRGIVRSQEDGQPLAALEYESYEKMARREMRRLLEGLGRQHPCLAVKLVHRVGLVPAGETAVYVGVAARHRSEAFALLMEFMDRLKQDVPIWKRQAHGQRCEYDSAVEEVLALVRAKCRVLGPERVPLNAAAGRVLREPVCAPEDQPAFDRSAMDGYAVCLDDPATTFRIVDELRAGDWKPGQLLHGQTVRVATGTALPGDGLQVVMQEAVQVEGSTMHVLRRETSRHVRLRGEEAHAGQLLLEEGSLLHPASLALLASLGQAHPLVTRLPRVLHLTTGNEIVPPEEIPHPGQLRDSNSTLVRAFLRQFGVEPEQRRVPEECVQASTSLASQLAGMDLLMVSGGTSVGEHDFTRALFEALGFHIHLCRTNTRPGKPLLFATRPDGKIALGLPGNPLAHFVCLNLFVRAALEKLAALPERAIFSTATLAAELKSDGNARETLWPAEVCWNEGRAIATPLHWSSSGDLTNLARANALLRVPPGCQTLSACAAVPFASTWFLA